MYASETVTGGITANCKSFAVSGCNLSVYTSCAIRAGVSDIVSLIMVLTPKLAGPTTKLLDASPNPGTVPVTLANPAFPV